MLPVTVKLGSGDSAKDVTLVGTYFNKPLTFGKEDFTHRRDDHAPVVESEGTCGDGTPPVQVESKTRQPHAAGQMTTRKIFSWASAWPQS